MLSVVIYIVSIILGNVGFAVIPPVILPNGAVWTPVALFIGFIFVSRDFAQRAVGHKVLFAMLIGGIASYFMATPDIAIASMISFVISELFDWACYTFTKKSFSQRVLLSSLIATPIDTFIFLNLISFFSWTNLLIMTASKLIGALLVYKMLQRKERLELNPQ